MSKNVKLSLCLFMAAMFGFAGSASAALVINEIHYHPIDYHDEFIEIVNTGSAAVDISGYALDDDIYMTFPAGASIAAGEYIVCSRYGKLAGSFQQFDFGGSLSNSGNTITLLDASGGIVDQVTFDDASPWPTEPDGSGPSAELIDASADNDNGANWAANNTGGATPGAQNSVSSGGGVVMGSCSYDQSSPGGTFAVCEETVSDADCAAVAGDFIEARCDTTNIVGTCVLPSSDIHYYNGDAAGLETGCDYQGGDWIPAQSNTGTEPVHYAAMPEALAALESDDDIHVSKRDTYYRFYRRYDKTRTGLIIHPGAYVDAAAYAPIAKAIALEAGTRVWILRFTDDLAVNEPNLAGEIIDSNSYPDTWILAGHSLGGVVAATYASGSLDNDELKGIAFWASYPAASTDLSASGLAAVSIRGTNDCLVSEEDVSGAAQLLPADTEYVDIVGGNHAQMGSYGDQEGDCAADISRDAQQSIVVQKTIELIYAVE